MWQSMWHYEEDPGDWICMNSINKYESTYLPEWQIAHLKKSGTSALQNNYRHGSEIVNDKLILLKFNRLNIKESLIVLENNNFFRYNS